MNTIGTTMKRVREENGLSQIALSKILAVTPSYISKVENGKEIPRPMFKKLFCLSFSINENDLAE